MKYLICFMFFCSPLFAQEPVVKSPEELKNLQWNRRTTENFVILSIDDNQGKWLCENIENIKTWSLTRWGFKDVKFSRECRIMCVPDKQIMMKLFGINHSRTELNIKEKDKEIIAIWLVLDEKPAKTIPIFLSEACFAEWEKTNHSLPFWSKRGMSLLNGTYGEIREQLSLLNDSLEKDRLMFFSKAIFEITKEQYLKDKLENKKIFDAEVIALCLLLRKELGETKFHSFLKNNNEESFKKIYGYKDYDNFDSSFKRYMKDISKDVIKSKIPDKYLEIKN